MVVPFALIKLPNAALAVAREVEASAEAVEEMVAAVAAEEAMVAVEVIMVRLLTSKCSKVLTVLREVVTIKVVAPVVVEV